MRRGGKSDPSTLVFQNAQLVPPFQFMIERMLFLTGNKWLSQAVHTDGIIPGAMNLVHAPVGSGKTTWAL